MSQSRDVALTNLLIRNLQLATRLQLIREESMRWLFGGRRTSDGLSAAPQSDGPATGGESRLGSDSPAGSASVSSVNSAHLQRRTGHWLLEVLVTAGPRKYLPDEHRANASSRELGEDCAGSAVIAGLCIFWICDGT